jgi:SAM-dependent MidA family methyltransferase
MVKVSPPSLSEQNDRVVDADTGVIFSVEVVDAFGVVVDVVADMRVVEVEVTVLEVVDVEVDVVWTV